MTDSVEYRHEPALRWAGNLLRSRGLPTDGKTRVLLRPDGTFDLIEPEKVWDATLAMRKGERMGGPSIIDPKDPDLVLAERIAFWIRKYRGLRDLGFVADAGFAVSMLTELALQANARYRNRENGKKSARPRKVTADERRKAYRDAAAILLENWATRQTLLRRLLRCRDAEGCKIHGVWEPMYLDEVHEKTIRGYLRGLPGWDD